MITPQKIRVRIKFRNDNSERFGNLVTVVVRGRRDYTRCLRVILESDEGYELVEAGERRETKD